MQSILYWSFILFLLSLIWACAGGAQSQTEPNAATNPAQAIVDLAIQKHGGKKYQNAEIEFDFRQKQYRAMRKNGQFQYERSFKDKSGRQIRDVLNNDGFFRQLDGQKVTPTEKERLDWSEAVNSVHYFVQLPASLNDPAVIKTYLGTSQIKGQAYDKVEVRFQAEGGGRDHEDVYLYWFNRKTHMMDYLAYNYLVNGGGARFRAAYNVRTVAGIRFADYINYKPKTDNRNVAEFDVLFEQGDLVEVSRIETENIRVN
ncbi:MAG: DUF6503 family protein [Bacteroidota bacterium]